MQFGDYCTIEQKRYVGENEHFLYKVIGGNRQSNRWQRVPVDVSLLEYDWGEISDVLLVVQCGVDETKVETVRLADVRPAKL